MTKTAVRQVSRTYLVATLGEVFNSV